MRDGDRLFIRSTNGRTADWFRAAVATGTGTGTGQIVFGRTTVDVSFAEAAADDLAAVDAAHRHKYGRYASIVDHLTEPGPRGPMSSADSGRRTIRCGVLMGRSFPTCRASSTPKTVRRSSWTCVGTVAPIPWVPGRWSSL